MLTDTYVPSKETDDFFYNDPSTALLQTQSKEQNKEEGSTHFISACVNVLCGVMTQGMFYLPPVFSRIGVIPSVIGLAFVAMISYLSSSLWIETMEGLLRHGWANKRSYYMVAFPLFGKFFAFFTRFAMMNFSFGVITGYILEVGDLLHSVFQKRLDTEIPAPVMGLLFVVILAFPFCLVRKITFLRYSSFATLLVYLYLIVVVAVRFSSSVFENAWNSNKLSFSHFGNLSIVREFPYITLAFGVHLNLFSVWNELGNKHFTKIKKVIKTSIFTLFVFYVIISTASYLYFYESGYGDVLINLFEDSDVLFQIGKALLLIVLAAATAILVIPIRAEVDLSFCPTRQPMTRLRRISESVILLVVPFLFSLIPFHIMTEILSAITGSLIFYILPGICYIRLDGLLASPDPAQRNGKLFWIRHGNWDDMRRILSFVLVILGSVFMVISLIAVFTNAFSHDNFGSESSSSSPSSSTSSSSLSSGI